MGPVTVPSTRVALADDDILLREGLASLLERAGFDVVAQCGDATQLIGQVRELRPDLVVVDIRMPPRHSTDGLDAARVIREEHPQTAVLVLSAHVEVEHAMDLLASGQGSGYLLKNRITDVPEFIDTLKRIVRGGSVVDPALVHELVAARRADDPLAGPHRPGAGGARADGRRPVQRRDRPPPRRGRGNSREARAQHPDEAAPPGDHR